MSTPNFFTRLITRPQATALGPVFILQHHLKGRLHCHGPSSHCIALHYIALLIRNDLFSHHLMDASCASVLFPIGYGYARIRH